MQFCENAFGYEYRETALTALATRLENRIVRYADLAPCYDAFIDTRTPGSDQKENFTIIGPGVSENPKQHVHITEPHGFNIGGARQPPGCVNSQHSHKTAEVFYVHSGTWRFDLGEHGSDAQICLGVGDLISIPTDVFRGFTNIGQDTGFLWAVLGDDDPGSVLWAPQVFDMASEYGLVLLEDGMLIDMEKGETIPAGKRPMAKTTPQQVSALQVFDTERLEACAARHGSAGPKGAFCDQGGVYETILIGEGRMNWPHGFQMSEIVLAPGAAIPSHHLEVSDVWFVQSGKLVTLIDHERTILGAGDTITIPPSIPRALKNASDQPVTLIAVRGSDTKAKVTWA